MHFFYNGVGMCGAGITYELFQLVPKLKIYKPTMHRDRVLSNRQQVGMEILSTTVISKITETHHNYNEIKLQYTYSRARKFTHSSVIRHCIH